MKWKGRRKSKRVEDLRPDGIQALRQSANRYMRQQVSDTNVRRMKQFTKKKPIPHLRGTK